MKLVGFVATTQAFAELWHHGRILTAHFDFIFFYENVREGRNAVLPLHFLWQTLLVLLSRPVIS